jgi:glycosyltransferase involved in cell wall biosynthesis
MIYTNFELPENLQGHMNVALMPYSSPGFSFFKDVFGKRNKISALLIANPSTKMLTLLALLKVFYLARYPIFIFDLILKCPFSYREKVVAGLKGFCIRRINFIITIHKDTSGYELYYGLRNSQFIYVPFKANNFDFRDIIKVQDGDYIVALGASQRDYKTLIDAASQIDYKIVIVCSDDNARKHNADIGEDACYPSNVTRIRETLDSETWYDYLAGARFVVIPILEAAIQPAGVSVYLEAMILGKAVVISEGASTNYILEHEKNAFLVPPGNAKKLAEALNRLAEDSVLRESLALAGRMYAQSLGNDAKLRENILKSINTALS